MEHSVSRQGRVIWATALVAIVGLLFWWARCGLDFYGSVIPFYDSLSYQEGFREVALRSREHGVWQTSIEVWRQTGNVVVLYKFAAAWLGPLLPGNAGLYAYLFSIHGLAVVVLGWVTWRSSDSVGYGIWSMATWLGAIPFWRIRDGVGDQRMDLASASFCLLVTCLLFSWARVPSWRRALPAGLAIAFASLHRPVMVTSFAVIALMFGLRVCLRQRQSWRSWTTQGLALAGPGLCLALPWLLAHAATLRHYYLAANVDVGNASSVALAFGYHARVFAGAAGFLYLGLLVVGVVGIFVQRRIDWVDAGVVLLATLLPLTTLALTRSTGNVYVGQLSLGLPVLLMACGRTSTARPATHNPWLSFSALGVFLLVACCSAVAVARESARAKLADVRAEVVQVIRGITAEAQGRRIAAFQDTPVNVLALTAIARDIGAPLMAGTRAYHAPEFGLPNRPLNTITVEEMRRAATTAIEMMVRQDDVLLLPTAETESRLLPEPLSHRLVPFLRAAVEGDARFAKLRPVGPVAGIRFDVFQIRRP